MSELEHSRRAERRAALRRLLATPLVLAQRDPEDFERICRHADGLIRWFDDVPGWRLSVEPASGFARLFKIPGERAGERPARSRSGVAFDRRRYTLVALALSALSDLAGQTTVRDLADRVRQAGAGEAGLEPFDPDRSSERRAFVDALVFLADAGILRIRDGDADGWARDRETGDALYDVNDRLLTHFLGGRPESHPDTEEGRRARARQEVVRAVLDEPVLYLEDLSQEAREWFSRGGGWLYGKLEDVGLSIERRLEGVAAVDPTGELSDELFPDGGSTVKHAALLLAEQIAQPARRDRDIGLEELERLSGMLLQMYGEGWSRQYPRDAAGASRLTADALALLENFGLARRDGEGWRARPAVARFRPGTPGTSKESE
jgi:hypothetical protein